MNKQYNSVKTIYWKIFQPFYYFSSAYADLGNLPFQITSMREKKLCSKTISH